jgi:hypothetical protein
VRRFNSSSTFIENDTDQIIPALLKATDVLVLVTTFPRLAIQQ